MSRIPQSEHKVFLYENDFNAICAEVYRHPHIETGGNLFGLWTTSGSAMIHIVLGPGQACRRTNTSFHQDINYMGRVGHFVNDGFMQCHIGEWHSHHNLSLERPSEGDERTIERNFPEGMSKFLVIIANIKSRDTIKLSPYFFMDGGKCYEKGEYVVLKNENPFLSNVKISEQVQQGAENPDFQQNGVRLRSRASLTNTENSQSTGSHSQQTHSTGHTSSRVARTGSQDSRNTASNNQRNFNNGSTYAQVTSRSSRANEVEPMDTSDTGSHPPPQISSPVDHNPPAGSFLNNQNDEGEKASPKEVILKEIYDELQKFFGSEGEIEIESGSAGGIHITFKHKDYYWRLRFPEVFPNEPAQLLSSCSRYGLSHVRPHSDSVLVKPLTSPGNILLSIEKNCRLYCETCKRIKKNNPAPTTTTVIDTSLGIAGNSGPSERSALKNQTTNGEDEREVVLKEIQDDLQKFFVNGGEVKVKSGSDGETQMTFKHFGNHWMVRFPRKFPNQPAQLVYSCKPDRLPDLSPLSNSHLVKPLINPVNIFLSIKKNCSSICDICRNISEDKLTKSGGTAYAGKTDLASAVDALKSEIGLTLDTFSLKSKFEEDGAHEITFLHDSMEWSIKLPAEYPDKPAEIYKQEGIYGAVNKRVDLFSNRRHEKVSLVSSDVIMSAIKTNCACLKCRRKRN